MWPVREDYYNYLFYKANADQRHRGRGRHHLHLEADGSVTAAAADGTTTSYAPVDFDTVGVKAVDEHTLTYTLNFDFPGFVSLLSYAPYEPAYGPLLEELGDQFCTSAETACSCGAFYLAGVHPLESWVMKKNPENYDRTTSTSTPSATSTTRKAHQRPGDGPARRDRPGHHQLRHPGQLAGRRHHQGYGVHGAPGDRQELLLHLQLPALRPRVLQLERHRRGRPVRAGQLGQGRQQHQLPQGVPVRHQPAVTLAVTAPEGYDNYKLHTITPPSFCANSKGVDYTECGDLANLTDFFDEAKAKEYRDAAVEELTAAGVTFPIKVQYPTTPPWWTGTSSVRCSSSRWRAC